MIKESDYIDIVEALEYEHFPTGKPVFEYGEMGTKFYIILAGKVSVSIPNPEIPDVKRKIEEI